MAASCSPDIVGNVGFAPTTPSPARIRTSRVRAPGTANAHHYLPGPRIDPHVRCIACRRALASVLGGARDQGCGRNCRTRLHPERIRASGASARAEEILGTYLIAWKSPRNDLFGRCGRLRPSRRRRIHSLGRTSPLGRIVQHQARQQRPVIGAQVGAEPGLEYTPVPAPHDMIDRDAEPAAPSARPRRP